MSVQAVSVSELSFSYREHAALKRVSFEIKEGEIFCFLGPNGSGKSTLFKILATLLTPTQGEVLIRGIDVRRRPQEVRKQIGVVFQAFGLDPKLTITENLVHQGHLYALSGNTLRNRIEKALKRLGIYERRAERVEKLSGGLQRRVELAKGILHEPRLILMDEPSTGLDPGARMDFWKYLLEVRDAAGATVLLTTHLLDEAEKCDRLLILDEGNVVGEGTPSDLKSEIGGDIISVRARNPQGLLEEFKETLKCNPILVNDIIHFEQLEGHQFIPKLIETFPGKIESVTVGKPTLEDVFMKRTGHQFWASSMNGARG